MGSTQPSSTREAVEPEIAGRAESTQLESPRSLSAIIEAAAADKPAAVGLAVVVFMIAFSFIGPLLYRTDQIHTALDVARLPPGSGHFLGTDEVGYDLLGRLMVAGQTSLEVGLTAALLATTFGVIWGAIAGFIGGALDALMMRVVDAVLAIPTLFLLIVLGSLVVPSVPMLILVIAGVSWMAPARLVRAETLSLKPREFIDAVRVMGGGTTRIVARHIIPNTIGTVVVNATFQVADAILAVAALSFLGFGVPPPAANWGGMLSSGVNFIFAGDWWLIYPAGVAIVLTVVAFNLVGDGLRDAFEVRLRIR
jgi:peptide/nickel transport system permease protein